MHLLWWNPLICLCMSLSVSVSLSLSLSLCLSLCLCLSLSLSLSASISVCLCLSVCLSLSLTLSLSLSLSLSHTFSLSLSPPPPLSLPLANKTHQNSKDKYKSILSHQFGKNVCSQQRFFFACQPLWNRYQTSLWCSVYSGNSVGRWLIQSKSSGSLLENDGPTIWKNLTA